MNRYFWVLGTTLGTMALLNLGCSGDEKSDDATVAPSEKTASPSNVTQKSPAPNVGDKSQDQTTTNSQNTAASPSKTLPSSVDPNNRLDILAANVPADALAIMAMQDVGTIMKEYHLLDDQDRLIFAKDPSFEELRVQTGIDFGGSAFLKAMSIEPNSPWGVSVVMQGDTPCGLFYVPTSNGPATATALKNALQTVLSKQGGSINDLLVSTPSNGMELWSSPVAPLGALVAPQWLILGSCGPDDAAGTQIGSVLKNISEPSFKSAASTSWYSSTKGIQSKPWKGYMAFNPKLPPKLEKELFNSNDPMEQAAMKQLKAGMAMLEGVAVIGNVTGGNFSASGEIACNDTFKKYSFLDNLAVDDGFLAKIPGDPLAVLRVAGSFREGWDSIMDADMATKLTMEAAYIAMEREMGVNPYHDLLAKLGTTMGYAIVADEPTTPPGLGALVWFSLQKDHGMDSVLEKMAAYAEKSNGVPLTTSMQGGNKWWGIDANGISVSWGVKENNLVFLVGTQYPGKFHSDFGTNSILGKMDASSQKQLKSKSHLVGAVDFRTIKKWMEVNSASFIPDPNDRNKTLEAMDVLGGSQIALNYDIPNKKITFDASLSSSTNTGFADFFKVNLDIEMAKSK